MNARFSYTQKTLQRFAFLMAFGSACTFFSSANAIEPETYFDISGAYRNDRVTTKINVYSPPGNFVFSSKLIAKSMNIWQAGAKGQIALCDYWFLKAYGNYGWGDNGNYSDKVRIFGCHGPRTRADINRVRVRDFQIGFGYLYPVDGCWGRIGLGPVWGWQYDDQHIKIHNARTDGFSDNRFNGMEYKTRWSGPWLGVDGAYRCTSILITGGFEYHWLWWHGARNLRHRDFDGITFSDRRHSHQAYGLVAYLKGRWDIFSCWHLGIELKYNFFEARSGRRERKCGEDDNDSSSFRTDKIQSARWKASLVSADIGYDF